MENFKSSIFYSDIYNRKIVEDIQKFHNKCINYLVI